MIKLFLYLHPDFNLPRVIASQRKSCKHEKNISTLQKKEKEQTRIP